MRSGTPRGSQLRAWPNPFAVGAEVERLNELAAWEADLSPKELDELYRYRLRRVNARLPCGVR